MNALPLRLAARIPVAPPHVHKDRSISWGWSLSTSERRADRDACIRTKQIDDKLLEVILDERNARTNAR